MKTFEKHNEFKFDTMMRLNAITKFKLCSRLELGALVELEQEHLNGDLKPAAWITEDITYVAFGNNEKTYFLSKDKLVKISKIKTPKYYEKTKTTGFRLDVSELEKYSEFII